MAVQHRLAPHDRWTDERTLSTLINWLPALHTPFMQPLASAADERERERKTGETADERQKEIMRSNGDDEVVFTSHFDNAV